MPRNLKQFKVVVVKKVYCDICGKEIKEPSSVRVTIWDTTKRYIRTNRPMIHNHKMRFCPKCLKKFREGFDSLLEKL